MRRPHRFNVESNSASHTKLSTASTAWISPSCASNRSDVPSTSVAMCFHAARIPDATGRYTRGLTRRAPPLDESPRISEWRICLRLRRMDLRSVARRDRSLGRPAKTLPRRARRDTPMLEPDGELGEATWEPAARLLFSASLESSVSEESSSEESSSSWRESAGHMAGLGYGQSAARGGGGGGLPGVKRTGDSAEE